MLVWSDQGLGDAIQFSRYIPILKQTCDSVLVECPPNMQNFMIACGAEDAQSDTRGFKGIDYTVAIGSLPRWLGTTVDAIPAPTRLPLKPRNADGVRRIGLCWQGSPLHGDDRKRSMPLAEMKPLFLGTSDIEWVSLQIGNGRNQLSEFPQVKDPMPDGPMPDVLRQANYISENLDAVVTVDTSIAHLAATVGVPTYLLLSNGGEWRWMSDRVDSPWYPSMRIFRQVQHGEWWGPIVDIADVLGVRVIPSMSQTPSELAATSARFQRFGDLDRAEELARRSVALNPDLPQLHVQLSLVLLQQGKFDEGWREHEWRLR
jgi:hypothetical protein